MRKLTIGSAFALVILASLAGAPLLYAEGSHHFSGSVMSNEMMGGGNKGGMMEQMGRMAGRCDNMMSNGRPNDQWRKNAPSEPEKKG